MCGTERFNTDSMQTNRTIAKKGDISEKEGDVTIQKKMRGCWEGKPSVTTKKKGEKKHQRTS